MSDEDYEKRIRELEQIVARLMAIIEKMELEQQLPFLAKVKGLIYEQVLRMLEELKTYGSSTFERLTGALVQMVRRRPAAIAA